MKTKEEIRIKLDVKKGERFLFANKVAWSRELATIIWIRALEWTLKEENK